MGQVISLLETGDMHAHDRASHQAHLANNRHQTWAKQEWQQNYNADQLGGGPLGTGYNMPQPRTGNGQVTINVPADRKSTRCAGAVAAGAGGGFVGGAAGGTAAGNKWCNNIPHPVGKGVCRAGSTLTGGAVGAYDGAKKGFDSGFCK